MKIFKKIIGHSSLVIVGVFAAVSTATADQVILDDLIVDGSACIGFDCVNGESFGFDTIRLKENNIRIKFDDTSTSASFPNNDWQLTANDSANGGANKFSIDDISGGRTPFTIEANAPSHSLYVDDGGRVGFGTSVPVVDLHVVSGNTPTLRLAQDGSSGFTPQTWDVAGNETNFFVRDATNGSKLPFKIKPGAPDNSVFISANGDIGFGTASPNANLDIEAATPILRLTDTGGTLGTVTWDLAVNNNTNRFLFQVDGGNVPFSIDDEADGNLMQLGITASNQVDITGNLVVSGTITPDFVFEPTYQLETIENHAAFMWDNKHLPAVREATPDGNGTHSINISERAQGVLHELEKAHIYIEQLSKEIKQIKNDRDEVISTLEERLSRLESK